MPALSMRASAQAHDVQGANGDLVLRLAEFKCRPFLGAQSIGNFAHCSLDAKRACYGKDQDFALSGRLLHVDVHVSSRPRPFRRVARLTLTITCRVRAFQVMSDLIPDAEGQTIEEQLVRAARDLWSPVQDSGEEYAVFLDHRALPARVQRVDDGTYRLSWETDEGGWVDSDLTFENPREAAFHAYQGPH